MSKGKPTGNQPPVEVFTKKAQAMYNDRNAKYLLEKNAWKTVAFMALVTEIILATGVIWETRQSRIVPYVVEVNKLGESLAVGPADKAGAIDPRIVKFVLARFVVHAREVIGDPIVEKQIIDDLWAHTTQFSDNFLKRYYRDHDPIKIGSKKSIVVKIDTVLAESKDSYRVRWHEDTWGVDGKFIGRTWWGGYFTVVIKPPMNEDDIRKNPLGIYVDQINWTLVKG